MAVQIIQRNSAKTKNGGPVCAEAVKCAQRGWPVFPCRVDKHPHTRHGFRAATTDERVIRRWWSRWPQASGALATGRPSGVVVVDVDPRHGASLDALEKLTGPLPASPLVETGGGGWHVYYALAGGREVRNSTNKIGPGFDVRGTGGYVVLPPSQHLSGNPYRYIITPDDAPLAPLPDVLVEMLAVHDAPCAPFPSSGTIETGTMLHGPGFDDLTAIQDGTANLDLATFLVSLALRRAPDGRNAAGFWLACQLRDHRFDLEVASLVLVRYAHDANQLVPSDHKYHRSEAFASLRQAYQQPPRLPCYFLPASSEAGSPTLPTYAESTTKIDGGPWDQLEAAALAADTLVPGWVKPKGRGRPRSQRRWAQYQAIHDAFVLAGWTAPKEATMRKWWSDWIMPKDHDYDAASFAVAVIRRCAERAAGEVQHPIGYVQAALCEKLGIPYEGKPVTQGTESTPSGMEEAA